MRSAKAVPILNMQWRAIAVGQEPQIRRRRWACFKGTRTAFTERPVRIVRDDLVLAWHPPQITEIAPGPASRGRASECAHHASSGNAALAVRKCHTISSDDVRILPAKADMIDSSSHPGMGSQSQSVHENQGAQDAPPHSRPCRGTRGQRQCIAPRRQLAVVAAG
jgi:hypothetical protein